MLRALVAVWAWSFARAMRGQLCWKPRSGKGLSTPSPTAGEGAQIQGGGAPRSLGPQAQMNMLGVLLEGQPRLLPLRLPPDGCSGLRAYSWLKSVLAGAGDVWVTLPSNLATCWLGTLPFSSQGSRKPPPGLPSSSVCLSYLQMKGAEILWTGE